MLRCCVGSLLPAVGYRSTYNRVRLLAGAVVPKCAEFVSKSFLISCGEYVVSGISFPFLTYGTQHFLYREEHVIVAIFRLAAELTPVCALFLE